MREGRFRLESPGAAAEKLYLRIPKHLRLTFFASLGLGFLAHGYAFLNKFTNHDDLNQMFYADYGTASGRWLLPPVLRLDGNISMPWIIGVLSLVFLALTACAGAELLRIRRPLGCAAVSALTVSFPAVTATFGYMFTASGYFFSLFLAALAALAACRRGWPGSAAGAVLLTLSMSIYQAYLPAAAVLMLGSLLLEALDGQRSFRQLLGKGLRLALTLALGVLAYLLTVRLTAGEGLTDYEGIADMGRVSLGRVPRLVYYAYRKYWYFFWQNDWGCHFSFLRWGFLLSGLGSLCLGAALLKSRQTSLPVTLLALALGALYPLAGALIYVMVPDGYVHIHMLYPMVYILLLPASLLEYAGPGEAGPGDGVLPRLLSWVLLLTLGFTAYSYWLTDNNAYMKADLAFRQCAAWSDRLVARIEDCEGYEPGMKAVLLGSDKREAAMSPTPELDLSRLVGIFDLGDLRSFFTYRHFLRYYLAYTDPVYTGDSETAALFAAKPEVLAMPLYPRQGSVKVVDGAVVVKLNEP
jgi:hypothetical protein